jgi:hypothetical protein
VIELRCGKRYLRFVEIYEYNTAKTRNMKQKGDIEVEIILR